MKLYLLHTTLICTLVLLIAYAIKRICGVGLFQDFPENLEGVRWVLAKLNVWIALFFGILISEYLLIPLIVPFTL